MRRVLVLSAAFCAVALAPGQAGTATLPGFHSPSGNIRCLLLAGRPANLLCNIGQAAYTGQLQDQCMARASVDWHGFILPAARKGMANCAGGILYTKRPVYVNLRYGTSWSRGGFTCDSRITGVTCRNAHGHGLFLSRASWRAW